MLKPANIGNAARPSGYNFVKSAGGMSGRPNSNGKPWHAAHQRDGKYVWRGPRRATPEEAAQDYCDYINGALLTPAPQLKTAGHAKPVSSIPSSPEAIEARRVLREEAKARREGRIGSVYLIVEEGLYQGASKSPVASVTVKIGHTYLDPPEARPAGLQTGNPRLLKMVAARPGSEDDERALHAKFIEHNILGEWFWNHTDILREFGLV